MVSSTPTGSAPAPSPSTPEASASAQVGGVPTCWTVAVPDVAISSSQDPEQFAQENPGLVQSGAPSPCSLVAEGSHADIAAAWLDLLLVEGWVADDAIEDDVYISRLAHGPEGWTAGYLVSKPGNSAQPITQFQLFQN